MSYIKLADWYLIVSFLFVFGTLVEFTVVLYLSSREKQREHRKEEEAKRKAKIDAQQFGSKVRRKLTIILTHKMNRLLFM